MVHLAAERALGMGRLMAENRRLKQDLDTKDSADEAVFESPEIRKVTDMALKVAPKDTTVMITGDSGVGKEVIARLIHDQSQRSQNRFVAVNCASFTETLIESELFGHEKGSFTGAVTRKEGKFEYAGRGTLFLDEIGELTSEAQVKLLRVIQEKCFQRVGGNKEIPTDVRLICATNHSLEQLTAQGQFRSDLYYRLTVFPIHIPGLKQRKADIVPLARHFIKRHVRTRKITGDLLTSGGIQQLKSYLWPGNIRELANVIERVMILKDGMPPVTSDDLFFIQARENSKQDAAGLFTMPAAGVDYDELQKDVVKQALAATAWNQSAAARMLGLSRSRFRTLHSLLEPEKNPGESQ